MNKVNKKNISEYKDVKDFLDNPVIYHALERLKDK